MFPKTPLLNSYSFCLIIFLFFQFTPILMTFNNAAFTSQIASKVASELKKLPQD